MKLYRSVRDKKISGLCGGLAESFQIDPTLLRLVVAVSAVFSGGTVLLVYLVACLIIPKESPYEPHFAGGYMPRQDDSRYTSSYRNHGGMQQSYRAPREEQDKRELDHMMEEIEKKALRKEIEELKQKLSQYENEKGDK
ncbi:PspC domain-containing protein [Marinicrinis sediminis]|uniref:PspC domain-containing protein n=1 Tax=Marinicrinis sediminis TaxID=1652465 RepID=A0ABW5RBB2_9BACL